MQYNAEENHTNPSLLLSQKKCRRSTPTSLEEFSLLFCSCKRGKPDVKGEFLIKTRFCQPKSAHENNKLTNKKNPQNTQPKKQTTATHNIVFFSF